MFRKLKELGLYEPMLIIVTSDHGESLGDHDTFKGHGLLWENGLRVPLIVKLPGCHTRKSEWQGKRIFYRVQSLDIAPTILSVAGLPVPESFQGQSLLTKGDRLVLAQRLRHKPGVHALVDDHYKLVVEPSKRSLFDLVADPGEVQSLYAKRPDLVRMLKGKLRALSRELQNSRDLLTRDEADPSVTLGPETRKKLKALGCLQ